MSSVLHDAVSTARFVLREGLPYYEGGKLGAVEELYGFTTMYRSLGVSEMLLRGLAEPLFARQMQSASLFAHGLPSVAEDEKSTSLAAPLWDAVGAGYEVAARQIAFASRSTHNPNREHEDDFLYVDFLLHRYYLGPGLDASDEERKAHDDAQLARLDRWFEVLEGDLDERLALCHALLERDVDAFCEALVAVADERTTDLTDRGKKGRYSKEELAWLLPVWPQGLALLRLAERDGLELPEGFQVPGVPPLLRVENRYAYHPDSWRSVDFRPGLWRS